VTKLFAALACAILIPFSVPPVLAVDKDTDRLTPDKTIAEKLVKLGDKVEVAADASGKVESKVTIGKNEYPIEIHVGENGKVQWALEEFTGADGKKGAFLTLRFSRPDGDNPSVQFPKRLAPKIKQLAVYLNTDVDTRGTLYVGKQNGDETENLPVDNQFSSLGNAGDKTVGPVAYITPKYETADGKKADGVTGLFVARTGTKTKTAFKDIAMIWGLTGFEQLPAKK
jgi:hypothetical protein